MDGMDGPETDRRRTSCSSAVAGLVAALLWSAVANDQATADSSDASGAADASPTIVSFPLPASWRPTATALRRRYPTRAVWRVTRYGESDPDFPIASFCVGRRPLCLLEFVLTPDRRLHGIVVSDPTFAGPRGVRVGLTYAALDPVLEDDCVVALGEIEGLYCDVNGVPDARVEFEVPGLYDGERPRSETPTSDHLARAHVVRFFWGAPSE